MKNYLKRTNLYLPVQLLNELKKDAREKGISLSELIRQILFNFKKKE